MRRLRRRLNLTQRKLAKILGLNSGTEVSLRETGRREVSNEEVSWIDFFIAAVSVIDGAGRGETLREWADAHLKVAHHPQFYRRVGLFRLYWDQERFA